MFLGEKLKDIRILNGFSRSELASMLNVSEQAIWQYETGTTLPNLNNINQLKQLFNVKAKYFYSQNRLTYDVDEATIAYRNGDREYRSKTVTEAIFLNFTSVMISDMERYVETPPNNLKKWIATDLGTDRENGIEELATDIRMKLGLEDNKDLLYVLEKNGAVILEKNLGKETDAYSTWTDTPFIVLSREKKSSVRRNFDLAHELGHLLMHYKLDINNLDKKSYQTVEQEANYFASCFLLPKEPFLADFQAIPKQTNPDAYIEMKEKWCVSIQTMEYRAYKLGQLTYEQNRYFFSSLNRKGYRTKEPLDDQIKIIKPGKIKALFHFVFTNQLMTLEEMLQYWHVEIPFLSRLFCIEPSFFESYLVNKQIPATYDFIKKAD